MKTSPPDGADCRRDVEDVPQISEGRSSYSARRPAPAAPVEAGQRLSALGVIPCDWHFRPLREVAQVQSGITKNSKRQVRDAVDVHYLRVANVQDGYLDLDQMSNIRVNRDELVRYAVLRGDVLMNEGGDLDQLGRGAMWRGEFDPCVHQNHVFVVRCRPGLLPEFLNAWTASKPARRYFLLAGKQTTNLASINKTALGELPVLMPRIEEQRAIADALSDVDGLLRALDALIAKKRAIKQAAMQQLLTGKTRLLGFGAAWETKRLGDHVTFLRNGTNSRADLTDEGHIKYLHYGDIHTALHERLNLSTDQLPSLPAECAGSLDRLRDGDLVFVDASEDIDGVGKSVEISGTSAQEVVSGLHTIAARFDKSVVADGFKSFLQFCPAFCTHLRRLAAGTKVYATNRSHIASAEIPLPPPVEQQAIATVLHEMGDEIAVLAHRRDKIRSIKQGMMQQLLTGRIRLVQPVTATTETAAS